MRAKEGVISGQDPIEHMGVYAAHLVRLVSRWGVTPDRLLRGTGIDAHDLEVPTSRVPDEAMHAIVLRAIDETREPALGIHLGMSVSITAHGSVGLAAMTARTLGDALMVASRFFELRSGHLRLAFHVDDALGVAEFEPEGRTDGIEPFVFESLFAGLGQMLRLLVERPVQCAFEVRYDEPKYFRGYAHHLPGPVQFGRPRYAIVFPMQQLAFPVRLADDFASREALARCESELASLRGSQSLVTSVRRQLRVREGRYRSLSEVASLRGVSERTLKRRLAEHGATFQQLLDDVRRDRAVELLTEGRKSVEAIAAALGYSDTANFRRAFRRWVGVNPATFRAALRSSHDSAGRS